jgi:type IV pilus assembly protein PilC
MSLIVTPGQLSQRADFYRQLGQFTAAGLGILQALEHLKRHPPAPSYRLPIARLLNEISHGFTFSESVRRLGQWLPEFDVALLHAGEQGGRLESCFQLLADYYADRARMARQVITDLLYPVFLLHFAVLIFAVVAFFQPTKWRAFLLPPVGFLAAAYLLTVLLVYASQSRHGETWRASVEFFLHRLPLLGTGRRSLALSRLAGALGALLSAGVTIIEAWELAVTACGSPALKRTVLAWRPELDAGRTPAEVLSASARFPELFTNQYASGEVSGKLDDTLRRLQQYYQEEGSRKIRLLAQWFPRGLYLFIALGIGFMIIRFYLGYFQTLDTIMRGF